MSTVGSPRPAGSTAAPQAATDAPATGREPLPAANRPPPANAPLAANGPPPADRPPPANAPPAANGPQAAAARPGLRERKKRETRHSLQNAAQRLVVERGFANVTIEDIASAANTSTRTFFNYFDSKEAALVEPDPEEPQRMAAVLAGRPAGEDMLEAVRQTLLEVVAGQADRLHRLNLLVRQFPEVLPRYMGAVTVFERVISKWAAERTGLDPATSLYPDALASLCSTSVRLAMTHWTPESGMARFAELITEFFSTIAASGGPPSTGRPPSTDGPSSAGTPPSTGRPAWTGTLHSSGTPPR